MNQELSIKVFSVALEEAEGLSQRALSELCGVSLGSIHCCIKALLGKGYLKAESFKNSPSKKGFVYVLTGSAIKQKKELTIALLHRKQAEYEALKTEIKPLENKLAQ